MSRPFRTTLLGAPVRIGEGREDQGRLRAAVEILARDFPSVRTETAVEGFRFVPLCEVAKFYDTMTANCETARHTGFTEGRVVGLAEGRRQSAQVYSELSGLLRDIKAQRERILHEAEAQVVEMTALITKKITFGAAKADPDITTAVIKGAIASLLDKRSIKVRVHPEHLPVVNSHFAKILAISSEIKDMTIEPDPRCIHGGCFVETPSGDLDARIESQFAAIDSLLRESVDESPDGDSAIDSL